MKRKIAAMIAVSPLWAFAQDSNVVYGVIDEGIRHGSNLSAGNTPVNGAATALSSGVNTTSRLGYRGREDLGGGLFTVYNLESGLNADVGTMLNATKFFDRASWVGLGGPWGTLTAGRQTTPLADAVVPVDPLRVRFASFNPNIAVAALSAPGLGIEYGSAGSPSGSYRLDNSLKYTGTFGPVTGRVMYALGESLEGQSPLSSVGSGLTYESDGLVVSGAYQKFMSANRLELDAGNIGASYRFGRVTMSATFGRVDAQTARTSQTIQKVKSVGATYAVSEAMDLTAAYYDLDRRRTAAMNDGYSRIITFVEYKLSRRTKIYAEADYTNWRGNFQGSGNGKKARGLTAGMVHSF